MIQAGNYLLIQYPSYRGKVFKNRLIELIEGESFPSDKEKAKVLLTSPSYLGFTARKTSVKNLISIMIRRLFSIKKSLEEREVKKYLIALWAISQIKNKIYEEVVSSKLNDALQQSPSDDLLKRFFLFSVMLSHPMKRLSNDLKIRLYALIEGMDMNDLLSYKISTFCSKDLSTQNIKTIFMKKFNNFSPAQQIEFMSEDKGLHMTKDCAIKLFIESPSYKGAYDNGLELILPHAAYFKLEDLKSLFGKIKSEAVMCGRCNQILGAGGMPKIFCDLLTKVNIRDERFKVVWKDFYKDLAEPEDCFQPLFELLQEDGVIE